MTRQFKLGLNGALIFVSFTLTALSAMAFLNNVAVMAQWNPKDGPDAVYTGPFRWLDWSAVDYSGVTTFIPFHGFLLILLGLLRIAVARKPHSEYFPFTRHYSLITVTLGLIGTIWGFIMIGFFDPGTVQMKQLIVCMWTALWSTLVALVWVYLVSFPVRSAMQWWHRELSGTAPASDSVDLVADLATLGAAIRGLGATVSGTGVVMDGWRRRAAGVATDLDALGKKVSDSIAAVTLASNTVNESAGKLVPACDALRKAAEVQSLAAAAQQKAVEAINASLAQERESRQKVEAKLELQLKAHEERVTALVAENRRLSHDLEARAAENRAMAGDLRESKFVIAQVRSALLDHVAPNNHDGAAALRRQS